jgi:hypothetical protein
MTTVGQRNLKLLGQQGKTTGYPDKLIPVYPPYNFIVQGYKIKQTKTPKGFVF